MPRRLRSFLPVVAALLVAASAAPAPGLAQEDLPDLPADAPTPQPNRADPKESPPDRLREPGEATPIVELGVLDKVTARVSSVTTEIDRPINFGTLTITPRACKASDPDDVPAARLFVEVVETKPQSQPAMVFSGWMFSQSPALSGLDHPVYDVWVRSCQSIREAAAAKAAAARTGTEAGTARPTP